MTIFFDARLSIGGSVTLPPGKWICVKQDVRATGVYVRFERSV